MPSLYGIRLNTAFEYWILYITILFVSTEPSLQDIDAKKLSIQCGLATCKLCL